MWYDRIVVAGPIPWYWIVAISIFSMALVCGLLLCACNHKTEWKNTFNELFLKAAHHDTEHRDRIRDMTSKKNFGPSKVLVHRFSKANMGCDRDVLPPDPRLTIEQKCRVGFDSTYDSSASITSMYPGGKQIDIVTVTKEHSGRVLTTLNPDYFNGNTDLPNMPLRSVRRPEEEPTETTSFPGSCHFLSTDEYHYSTVDSGSLDTECAEEFTVQVLNPQKRRRLENFRDNTVDISSDDEYSRQGDIKASDYGGYDHERATLESDDAGHVVAQLELVPGPLHNDIDALTLSSTSVSTTLARGSIDSTKPRKPLLTKQGAASERAKSEIETSNLPPIDSHSSWSSSVLAPQSTQLTDSISVSKVGIGSSPMGEMTRSWASSVVKDRPVSARTKWSDETNSSSSTGDMALENCDYSSDTSSSYPLEA